MKFPRKFLAHAVFWRRLLRWGMLHTPHWVEPLVIGTWSCIFLLWRTGRRGVMANLTAVLPGSTRIGNFFRTYRVFMNFAWTIADNVRFLETRVVPDWDIVGADHFAQLEGQQSGAIILTAHMGSYDLGANLFAEISKRPIVMVRAPEVEPETREYEQELHGRAKADTLKVDFSTRASDLAFDLLAAVQRGELVAIQGDRVTSGISTIPATLFGKSAQLPAGPFALAMAARVPIYPLFIVRLGRRRYRLIVAKPIEVIRTRRREEAFERAMSEWTNELEQVIRPAWFQWFAFTPYSEELAR